MEDNTQKIRIKDIAKLAGVSEGTVDRVLHKRGDVSEKSREAVQKVLKEINYTPNLLARSLASKKNYHFACLFPTFQSSEYWESIDNGFNQAAQEFQIYNVQIDKFYFNQYDSQSFVSQSETLIENKPDAVIIAPIFSTETISLINKLNELSIPYSFIDSKIEDTNFNTYYGQNSFQSGYIAAKLLISTISEGSQIVMVRTKRKGSESNQTISRINGFYQYFNDNNLQDKFEIISAELSNNDEAGNLEVLKGLIDVHLKIKALITFNSKVYLLATHLEILQQTQIRLIGYDLLKQNVEYLQKGVINYLIAQRPDKQAYFTIRDMYRKLISKQDVVKINYVPIDILLKENIDDYMHYNQ